MKKQSDKSNDRYGKAEADSRFEAALRGALNTPPSPMKTMPSKRESKRTGSDSKSST
jgi:hypothetical protein